MKRSLLYLLALLYLSIPCAIFMFGWYDWMISVPAVALIAYMIYALTKDVKGTINLGSMRFEMALMLVVVLWVLISGVGGFCWQNRWDHFYRNALFRELVNNSWPIIHGSEEVCYYFGYWLPSALVAKALNSLQAGYAFQVIWGCVGIWLTFRMLFDKLKDISWKYVVVFILFGGLDIIGNIVLWRFPLRNDLHIELWNSLAFFESNSTMLCWVYNQVIPAWVGTMLIFSTSMSRVAPFVLAIMLISCPFPVVGLFPLVLFYVVRDGIVRNNWLVSLRNIFSVRNLIALFIGVLAVLFMSRTKALQIFEVGDVFVVTWHLVLLFALEIGFLYPFVRQWICKRDFFILCGLLAVLALLPLSATDLPSRAFIPLSVLLTIGCCQFVKHIDTQTRTKRVWFYILGVIVSVTACLELSRGVFMTIREPQSEWRNEKLKSIFDESICRPNFITPVSEH